MLKEYDTILLGEINWHKENISCLIFIVLDSHYAINIERLRKELKMFMKKEKMPRIIVYLLMFSMLISMCDTTALAKSENSSENSIEETENYNVFEDNLNENTFDKKEDSSVNSKDKNTPASQKAAISNRKASECLRILTI